MGLGSVVKPRLISTVCRLKNENAGPRHGYRAVPAFDCFLGVKCSKFQLSIRSRQGMPYVDIRESVKTFTATITKSNWSWAASSLIQQGC